MQARGKVEAWCMPILDDKDLVLNQSGGLLLRPIGQKFRRVGVFRLKKLDWFEDCDEEIVELI